MYKCADCNAVFREPKNYRENLGNECVETVYCCPHCSSTSYDEAIKCPKCNNWVLDDEWRFEMCNECFDNAKFLYRYDAQKCFDLAKDEKKSVELNVFLLSQFSVEEIEKILLSELKWDAQAPHSDYINFIEEDEMWFAESVVKGGDNE